MSILFNIVLPVFLMIFCGYILARKKILNEQASEALNRLVYFVSFPALLFVVVAKTPKEQILNWPFLGAWLGSVVIVFALTALVSVLVWRDSLSLLGMRSLNTTCSSTAFIGIPLCVAAFGPEAALPAALATTLLAVFDLSAAILLLELDRNTSTSGLRIVRNIATSLAKNPLMIGVMAGLVVAFTVGTLPVAVSRFCELAGGAAIPCSLIALGLFFADHPSLEEWAEVSVLSFIKLIIHPVVAYLLIVTVFPMDAQLTVITVLLASLPPATTVFVVAQRYKAHMRQTSAVMLVTTLLSVFTTYAILHWMAPG